MLTLTLKPVPNPNTTPEPNPNHIYTTIIIDSHCQSARKCKIW